MSKNNQQTKMESRQNSLIMDLYKTKPSKKGSIADKIDYRTNPDRYSLHCYFPFGTWIIDEVSYERHPLLFCVEGNSRYLFVWNPVFLMEKEDGEMEVNENGGSMTAETLQIGVNKLLEAIRGEIRDNHKYVRKVSHIIWDDAGSHKSLTLNLWLKTLKITVKRINVSKEPHGPITILDRCVRTIRDLIDTYQRLNTNAGDLRTYLYEIVDYYNKSPHVTLEKMTRIKGMTPWNVHVSEILERQVVKYCKIWNYEQRLKGKYTLNIGDKVLVKIIAPNKKSFKKRSKYRDTIYTIVEKKDGKYRLEPPHELGLVPRSMLIKIKKKRS